MDEFENNVLPSNEPENKPDDVQPMQENGLKEAEVPAQEPVEIPDIQVQDAVIPEAEPAAQPQYRPQTDAPAPQVPVFNYTPRNFNDEQPYSPYAAKPEPPYAAPPVMQPEPVQASQPAAVPKKKNTGLKVLLIIVSVIAVAAIATLAVFMSKFGGQIKDTLKNKPGTSDSTANGEAQKQDPDVDAEVPALVAKAEAADALTSVEIAKKGRASCVGILVYSETASVFSTGETEAGEGTGICGFYDKTETYTYIITCAHVINDKGVSVKVQTEDGTLYDADIIGFDTRTDLGVVRVKAKLDCAEFGDSDKLAIGSEVFAVGNPGGVEFFGSVTRGIVSAIERPVDSEIGYTMKCIQHDAAINPGNSGGALLNVFGQVIGINSQKIASTEYEGMGFAIPIKSAMTVIQDIVDYGYVTNRPKLGIQYVALNGTNKSQYYMLAQINKLPAGSLIICEISEDSSLAGTDAKVNDLIVAVDGVDMDTSDTLLEKIDKGKVGDELTLTIARFNSDYSCTKFDVKVKLVEDKDSGTAAEEATSAVNPYDFFGGYGW